MGDQSRLLDFTRTPQIILQRIDALQHYVKEEVLFDYRLFTQERNSSLDQDNPEPLEMKQELNESGHLEIKEEENELCVSQDKEHLVLKQDTDTFMVTPIEEEKYNIKLQPKLNELMFQDSCETLNQDQEANHHQDSGSKRDEEPKQNKTHQKTRQYKANSDSSRLKELKKTHKDEKLYACKMCSECFSQNRSLTIHMRSHS
ncbi:hypothetical protein CHARACLAT_025870, partial [Characodon lateralis]|nr:hypothetical protein [Characodon lateralis]